MSRCLFSSAAMILLAGSLGCATTQATTTMTYAGSLPRPERILVYAFATSPEEVKLDSSPSVVAAWKLEGVSESSERRQVARSVADTLADNLVAKIQAFGLPAERAEAAAPPDGRPTLGIGGHFLSIDEGSRAARVVIGLGAGKSDVRTVVHVFTVSPEGRRVVDEFEIVAKSGSTPGMAETMGAGAVAGHLATAAVVSTAKAIGSEAFGDDVEADARRTAGKVATLLEDFFAQQGWIAPAQTDPN